MRDIITLDAPHHPYVYEMRHGLVVRHDLETYEMPRTADTAFFLGGPMPAETVGVLSDLAALADRICPWIRVLVGPKPLLESPRHNDFAERLNTSYMVDGVQYSPVGGVAFYNGRAMERVIVVSSCFSAPGTFSILAHELMHQVYACLGDEARDLLVADLASRREWGSTYLDDHEELACRAFEAWFVARLQGIPPAASAPRDAEFLFREVESGRWATDLMRRRHIDVSPSILRRRGLLLRATTKRIENAISTALGVSVAA